MPRGGMGWGGRGRGRRRKMRMIGFIPQVRHFYPAQPPVFQPKPPIFMTYEEFEALRLVDYEGADPGRGGSEDGCLEGGHSMEGFDLCKEKGGTDARRG